MTLVDKIDQQTKEWMDSAAQGDAMWVCSDCGATVFEGMPDKCVYGHQSCTDILLRDKARALQKGE